MAGSPTDSPLFDPDFNPYQAPKTKSSLAPLPPGAGLWREGNLLVMRKDAELPDRCVRCNAPADGYRLKRNLSWHHPAFYLIVLFNLLIYVIVALIVRKTAKIYVGLCEEHRRKRTRTILTAWFFSLLGIALIVAAIAYSGPQASPSLGILALVGLLMWLGFMIWGAATAPPVAPVKIDHQFVWLKKVSPLFLDTLPEVPDVAPSPVH